MAEESKINPKSFFNQEQTAEGGKLKYGKNTLSDELGHTRGTVTDPEEKKQQEAYMLKYVNEERALQGLKPLKKLSYAQGVELTKEMGAGPKVIETSDENLDFDNMIKTTTQSKTVGDKTIFKGSIGLLTEEDKQAYFESNPEARMMNHMQQQFELDALGADISESAKINAREKGGEIRSGQPYLVGEKGPEMIIPNSSGQVITNSNLRAIEHERNISMLNKNTSRRKLVIQPVIRNNNHTVRYRG